ncbi:IclR family transcriptional regulator [Ancylobacter pratisalsi]|uniref:Helix-turn-helix domain-containing protein n=1 Tax=Ancylobacter pratisalsi TaxID=1745854 RepID=A0A6P1YLJ5_9HYPH|nr:IclR family transcriptional regulator C-terminal domain-containing protein [Ancylobacter pratisalsi]QIB33103.1 helix-turn-helix domain-containing protein [Ancylobacter pratisalsi]
MATHTTRSIVKAFDLLQVACLLPRSASLRDVAAKAEISVATAHRILSTLKNVGAIRVAADGSYELGQTLADLRSRDIVEAAAARRIIDSRLAVTTRALGTSTRLATLDSQRMLHFVAGADRLADTSGVSRVVGARFEAYFHAAGKLLLSALEPGEVGEYLAAAPLVPVAAKTITNPGRLVAELRQIARLDYAVEDEEFVNGEHAFAVPLRDDKGTLIAALSASRRLPHAQNTAHIVHVLRTSANALAKDLHDEPKGVRAIGWLSAQLA